MSGYEWLQVTTNDASDYKPEYKVLRVSTSKNAVELSSLTFLQQVIKGNYELMVRIQVATSQIITQFIAVEVISKESWFPEVPGGPRVQWSWESQGFMGSQGTQRTRGPQRFRGSWGSQRSCGSCGSKGSQGSRSSKTGSHFSTIHFYTSATLVSLF